MNYNYGFDDGQSGFDLYRSSIKASAKKIFSRFHLSLFLMLIISYAVTFAIEAVMVICFADSYNEIFSNVYFVSIISVLPMYAVGLPTLFLIVRKMPKKTLEKSKIPFSEFIILFAIAEALMLIGSTIGNTFNGIFEVFLKKEITDGTSELIENMPIWLMIIIVVIIGPLVEEFIFRKLMIDRLSRCGNILAITVSAIAFGLFHGNFYQFFYAALLGWLLGYVYVRSGKWVYSFIMHAIINFFGSVAVLPIMKMSEELLTYSEALLNGEAIDMKRYMICSIAVSSYSIIQYAVAVAGIIMLVLAFRKKRLRIKSSPQIHIPREDIFSVVFLNVGTILFVGFSILVFGFSIISGII